MTVNILLTNPWSDWESDVILNRQLQKLFCKSPDPHSQITLLGFRTRATSLLARTDRGCNSCKMTGYDLKLNGDSLLCTSLMISLCCLRSFLLKLTSHSSLSISSSPYSMLDRSRFAMTANRHLGFTNTVTARVCTLCFAPKARYKQREGAIWNSTAYRKVRAKWLDLH